MDIPDALRAVYSARLKEENGRYYLTVPAREIESDKPLWVREHSCPACGFEMDRDANAALNILSRGFEKLGLGQSEDTTPVETALPMFTSSSATDVVDVNRVIETGSPCLKEPPKAASRQG